MIKVEINKQVPVPYPKVFFSNIIKKTARFEKKITGNVEVNIVDSATIKKLNKVYRDKNSVTDVLSFSWKEDRVVKSDMLGQIYLCYGRIKDQAKDFKVTTKEEISRMLIHGLLHLVGHDHISSAQAKKMFSLQEKVLQICQKGQ